MRIVLYYTVTMCCVMSMIMIALAWCHLSHLHVDQGPMLFPLWGTHGVHVFDIAVLGLELILVALLSLTLITGFSRR